MPICTLKELLVTAVVPPLHTEVTPSYSDSIRRDRRQRPQAEVQLKLIRGFAAKLNVHLCLCHIQWILFRAVITSSRAGKSYISLSSCHSVSHNYDMNAVHKS